MKTPFDPKSDEKPSNTHIVDMSTEEVKHLEYLWEKADLGVRANFASDTLIQEAVNRKSDYTVRVVRKDDVVFDINVELNAEETAKRKGDA